MLIKTDDKYNHQTHQTKMQKKKKKQQQKRIRAQSHHKTPENNVIITSKKNLKANAKYRTLNTKY